MCTWTMYIFTFYVELYPYYCARTQGKDDLEGDARELGSKLV